MAKKSDDQKFELREITFNRTANVFLNTGIVALHHYLKQANFEDLMFTLTENELTVSGEKLLERLEIVYYDMGKEVYDTITNKQLEENGNAFYDEANDRFVRFPKISTLGLTELFTNNSQGLTSKEENQTKIEKLKQARPELGMRFEAYFKEQGLVLGSNVYLNERYTKITRLTKPEPAFLENGNAICDLTGEGFRKLEASTSTSAFLSGMTTFNSFLNTTDKKISWKALYLSRFAPKFCLYRYTWNGDDKSLFCYLFETDNLLNYQQLLSEKRSLFMDSQQRLSVGHLANFKTHNFKSKKGDEERSEHSKDLTEPSEMLFMLLYTIYKELLFNKKLESGEELEVDIFADEPEARLPMSLILIRADKFASTMRPSAFEQFNQFKSTIRLIAWLEKQGLSFQEVFKSTVFQERSDRSAKDSYRRARRFRDGVFSKILRQKSILPDFENLFFKCFLYSFSSDEQDKSEVFRKDWYTLFQLVNLYEPIIQSRRMEKEKIASLQERAVNLGKSIGMSVIKFDDGTPESNAKQARAYMIHLHKARTAEQFREALIRFQKKYGLMVHAELLEAEDMNDDKSFVFIKQFAVMAALNILNGALRPKKSDSSTTSQPITA